MWSQLLRKYNLESVSYFYGKDVALKSRHTASSELLGSFFTWTFFGETGICRKGGGGISFRHMLDWNASLQPRQT